MSPRKIMFFAIVGIVLVSIVIIVNILSKKQQSIQAPSSLTIWVTDDTSEAYSSIVEGFKKYAPEYTKTTVTIENKASDPLQYRTILLNTIADGKGPDIFVVPFGEDIILESKVAPIPSDRITLAGFDKKYEDIFFPLVISSGAKSDMKEYLLGVPMGYETLGMFYNKSLVQVVPKTWNDLDILYSNGIKAGIYPSNLGLGPRYTPNMSDILGLFLGNENILSYRDLGSASTVIASYLKYGNLSVSSDTSNSSESDIYATSMTLASEQENMDRESLTTYDLFMQGKIGIVFGFPSTIAKLEKALKRAESKATDGVILTERIPQNSMNQAEKNLARFHYFAVSKASQNGEVAVKFLEYLMTQDAEQKYLSAHPYMIPAQREFYPAQAANRMSTVLARTKLDAFIPVPGEKLFVFDYGLKSEFSSFLDSSIDRNNNSDISNVGTPLSTAIQCAVAPYNPEVTPSGCEKTE